MLMRTSSLLSLSVSDLQHTIGHIDCPACEAARLALHRTTDLKALKFSAAAAVCLDDELRYVNIKPRTHKDHRDFVRRLTPFFGELVLEKIHEGHILSYQQQRAQTAGPELINHEISYLGHVMDKAGLWKALKPRVTRLHVPKKETGKALTADQQDLLKTCASSNPRWSVAYWGTLLSLNIAVGPGEICHLRVRDLDVRNRLLEISVDEEHGKNEYRADVYPMNDTMLWVCNRLLKRYYKICEKQGIEPLPDHFVLPYNAGRNQKAERKMVGFDPTRPQSGWRSAWRALLKKAGLEIRNYDLRHTSGTAVMEDAALAPEVVQKFMRHGTDKMKKRYFHANLKTMGDLLERHEVKPAPKLVETDQGIVQVPVIPEKRKPVSADSASPKKDTLASG
jgi:integrase